MTEWIGVTEAAEMLGYDPDYFRRAFCVHPVNGIAVLVIRKPGAKYSTYRVLRADVVALVQSSKRTA